MSTAEPNELKQDQGHLELLLVSIVTVMTFGLVLLFGFVIVNPREEIVVLRFGKYVSTLRRQGISWIHPVGRALHRIPTRDMTHDIPVTTVLERNGNPIQISAIVVYRVDDSYKAALEVESYRTFIEDQASAVIKRVSAQFPYESPDHSEPCLKLENDTVNRAFVQEMQEAVQAAGVRVLNVRMNDLTYAPEIAQAMLMRQQAMALIDARKTIVEGAVEIVKDAVQRLSTAELHMSDEQREQLISNLLVVICSGERAQPVVQVQPSSQHRGRH
ncbi:peptidase inhibitor I87 [Planctomyces bekefii]|uniref:Peptidase inhibitor I87 n=1 Tax=Planctomyces bekefii TaxID=1653850 RepID=A0A5C6M5C0_9PLAN|nr:peptidase inhibitor I87 [Planctomyces bekefii]